MDDDLAARLRAVRERRGWTVADMSERTGIPKRTLDKYMLRTHANLPGFEALLSLSKGLGVSLDWLAFGSDFVSEGSDLLAHVAAEKASLPYFEMIYHKAHTRERMVDGEELLGMTPEEWAFALAYDIGEKAKEMAGQGVTREELLISRQSSKDFNSERLRARFDRMLDYEKSEN